MGISVQDLNCSLGLRRIFFVLIFIFYFFLNIKPLKLIRSIDCQTYNWRFLIIILILWFSKTFYRSIVIFLLNYLNIASSTVYILPTIFHSQVRMVTISQWSTWPKFVSLYYWKVARDVRGVNKTKKCFNLPEWSSVWSF